MKLQTGVSVQVDFTWCVVGRVTLDAIGKPAFPKVPSEPGIYWFRLVWKGRTTNVYVGESYHLAKRMRNYRTPPKTAMTSQRLHDLLVSEMEQGVEVELAVATRVRGRAGEETFDFELDQKSDRCLAENAALLLLRREGIPTLNLPGIGGAGSQPD